MKRFLAAALEIQGLSKVWSASDSPGQPESGAPGHTCCSWFPGDRASLVRSTPGGKSVLATVAICHSACALCSSGENRLVHRAPLCPIPRAVPGREVGSGSPVIHARHGGLPKGVHGAEVIRDVHPAVEGAFLV